MPSHDMFAHHCFFCKFLRAFSAQYRHTHNSILCLVKWFSHSTKEFYILLFLCYANASYIRTLCICMTLLIFLWHFIFILALLFRFHILHEKGDRWEKESFSFNVSACERLKRLDISSKSQHFYRHYQTQNEQRTILRNIIKWP